MRAMRFFQAKEIYIHVLCRLVGAKEKLAEAWMMVGISHGEAGNVKVTSLSFVLTEQLEIRDFGLVCASSSLDDHLSYESEIF